MKITLRADDTNPAHTRFTVFANGANCGQLVMTVNEANAFYMIITNGVSKELDEFTGKGRWSPEEDES